MLTVNFLYKVFHKPHAVSFCNHGAKEITSTNNIETVGFHLFAVDWMVINQFSFQLQIKFYPSFKSRKNLSFIFLVSWVFFVTVKSPSQL